MIGIRKGLDWWIFINEREKEVIEFSRENGEYLVTFYDQDGSITEIMDEKKFNFLLKMIKNELKKDDFLSKNDKKVEKIEKKEYRKIEDCRNFNLQNRQKGGF